MTELEKYLERLEESGVIQGYVASNIRHLHKSECLKIQKTDRENVIDSIKKALIFMEGNYDTEPKVVEFVDKLVNKWISRIPFLGDEVSNE